MDFCFFIFYFLLIMGLGIFDIFDFNFLFFILCLGACLHLFLILQESFSIFRFWMTLSR